MSWSSANRLDVPHGTAGTEFVPFGFRESTSFDGPMSIHPSTGLVLFGSNTDVAMGGADVRSVEVYDRALSAFEVVSLYETHQQLTSWQCTACSATAKWDQVTIIKNRNVPDEL